MQVASYHHDGFGAQFGEEDGFGGREKEDDTRFTEEEGI